MHRSRTRILAVFTLAAFQWVTPDVSGSADDQTAPIPRGSLSIRQEFNAVSARIDSLIRVMSAADPTVIDKKRLPGSTDVLRLPKGTSVVCIFWADDEARVWINDFLVGETRLTPVEIEIPHLYLKGRNRIRVRCWDTDHVESGFLFGLYLKDAGGALRPILVSDDSWRTTDGRALEITYAHPVPDIPSARVIWQTRLFGQAEFMKRFDRRQIEQALSKPARAQAPKTRRKRMDYHGFLQNLISLQETRARIKRQLLETADPVLQTAYAGHRNPEVSFTLGKAGPLKEETSLTFAKEVESWAEKLAEAEKRLVYPEKRALKGEGAAISAARRAATGTARGDRRDDYRPPDERSAGEQTVSQRSGREGKSAAAESGGRGGFGGSSGRGSRAGLLFPSIILAAYIWYVVSKGTDGLRI
ncbi:MAG: hypothetical protein OXH06_11265 [Gemmatimonadetes bacterium]|nr:hypothetical protein [Gemmatimonadota bacterium]MDE3256547.1 hypothetical protein [Gemmatimonadota bacterium]